MSMRRSEQTLGTRIMLPSYLVFFAWLGLGYTFSGLRVLLGSPVLSAVQDVLGIRVLGVIFLAMAIGLVAAMVLPDLDGARPMAAYVLWVGVVLMFIWMCFLIAAWLFAGATVGAGAYAFLPMMACYTTSKVLTDDS